jgi:hypothetical protein
MSPLQIARDDEEIRCVPLQRVVSVPVQSRVLVFPSPVEMSPSDRLRRLEQADPESAAMIDRVMRALDAEAGR